MQIREIVPDNAQLERPLAMSAEWEREKITYGYGKNNRESILPYRVFIAEEDGEILGYLFGRKQKMEQPCAVMPQTDYFEIEELYVVPEYRSKGIGRKLYCFAEQQVKRDGMGYIMLSTATKDYKKILHFYIDELGMDFWTAVLFKKLSI